MNRPSRPHVPPGEDAQFDFLGRDPPGRSSRLPPAEAEARRREWLADLAVLLMRRREVRTVETEGPASLRVSLRDGSIYWFGCRRVRG